MNILLYRGREIELQFACVAMGGIPIFTRAIEPDIEDQSPVYVYADEYQSRGWQPRILQRKILVGMSDVCPDPFLTPYQYRIWNEHLLAGLVRRLSGNGVLTLSHRKEWPWHFGLCWSLDPLMFANRCMTDEAPTWWGAEGGPDLNFHQLQCEVQNRQAHYVVEWNRQMTQHLLRDPVGGPGNFDPEAFRGDLRAALNRIDVRQPPLPVAAQELLAISALGARVNPGGLSGAVRRMSRMIR